MCSECFVFFCFIHRHSLAPIYRSLGALLDPKKLEKKPPLPEPVRELPRETSHMPKEGGGGGKGLNALMI